ncbi:hypothetical protein VSH64_14250 [Amycolatopsis rhabdoformis]|uniref:Uncharacterized protein n=1 Tax=Amycolatopsis rhabdoformis TaxID=1448059 RepID=A0ABZ1IG75_9PSEU|nr:hypothetical protein [Amycolatopsis rhabdoformis]WSE33262.1 hypothetical protein VSH64_14250 [Amycolatopsis rhabdoformis]
MLKNTATTLTIAGLLTVAAAGVATAQPLSGRGPCGGTTCVSTAGAAHAGTLYLDYDLQGGGYAQELKLIANNVDLSGCSFSNVVHAPATGTMTCHLGSSAQVVAYARMQNTASGAVGWHQ